MQEHRLSLIIGIGLLLGAVFLVVNGSGEEVVPGVWVTTGGESTVEIKDVNGELVGTIASLAEPLTEEGEIKTDRDNPDPDLRSQPIIGLKILWGFKRDRSGSWGKGRVYDPEEGRTYYASIERRGTNLVLRGSLDRWGVLGRTVIWSPYTKKETP